MRTHEQISRRWSEPRSSEHDELCRITKQWFTRFGYARAFANRPKMDRGMQLVAAHLTLRFESEYLVKRGNYIVGYCDLVARRKWEWLEVGMNHSQFPCGIPTLTQAIFFEIKPRITSVGDVLRQVKTYRDCCGGTWAVVTSCCEIGLFSEFDDEGITLIELTTDRNGYASRLIDELDGVPGIGLWEEGMERHDN